MGILVALFGFYMFLHEGRDRDFYDKLTRKEKNYLDILETWFYISNITLVGILWGSFSE